MTAFIRMIGSTGMDIGLPKYRPPGEAKEEAAARFRGEMAKQ
jgi:hypothetical protein